MSYNLDDFITDTKKTIDKVAVKTSDAVAYSKIQLERAQLRSLLKDNFAKLGRLCYVMHTTENDVADDMKIIIADIKKLEEELAKTEKATPNNKSKVCKYCLTKNSSDSDYCRKCGEFLS